MTHDDNIYDRVMRAVAERLPRNQRLRRTLPHEGRLRLDRQTPYLCVYRRPSDRDDHGTRELITTEAAYLATTSARDDAADIARLCLSINRLMHEHFGRFLFIEVWTDPNPAATVFPFRPRFTVVAGECDPLRSTLGAFVDHLESISLGSLSAEVSLEHSDDVCPPQLPPLLGRRDEPPPGTFTIGLRVAPFFRNEQTGSVYPVLLRQLRRPLSAAIRAAVSTFANSSAPAGEPVAVLGQSAMVKAARDVDQQLAEISAGFDFLLQVTPVNSDESWETFSAGGETRVPEFIYRPLLEDPSILKRRLYRVPLEEVEDPTLMHLLAEKQVELDRQLSALRDLNTPAFRQHSVQLFGGVEHELLEQARSLLTSTVHNPDSECEGSGCVPVEQVADAARDEIAFYRDQAPGFSGTVEISDHIAAGMMVSRDRLLISRQLALRPHRVLPILQHEVGTHLLTYYNGRQQPLQQLSGGLAGYEGLQEGLALLAEYLSGGLTVSRLRTLAGRVVAVWSMLNGAEPIDTYRLLKHEYGLVPRIAFITMLRAHRGGGLTKDAVYLRGLLELLNYLGHGHELEPLLVGKFSLTHVPFIQELRRRDIVRPPALLPRYIADPDCKDKIGRAAAKSLFQLLEQQP